MHPRKVRGGVRLESKEGAAGFSWAGQRWMRLVEDLAPGAALAEGLTYAKLGQTRNFSIAPSGGLITARVQGRMPGAYTTEVRMPVLTHEQWDQVIGAMLDEARHLAGLLSGDVPPSIEDLFAPLHLRLFPQEGSDLAVSCTCGRNPPPTAAVVGPGEQPNGPHSRGGGEAKALAPAAPSSPWCKHVCCVMTLVAERLSKDPFLIFSLRGLNKDDLLERLRQRRAVLAGVRSGAGESGGDRPAPAYSPRIPGVGDDTAPALEEQIDGFWDARPELRELVLPLEKPEVNCVLLRRLGPSPFEAARFPLLGLLATCYEVLSARALGDATSLESGLEGSEASRSGEGENPTEGDETPERGDG